MIKLILASQSPRRKELLKLLNIPFISVPAHADEDSVTVADPVLNVQQTAVLKADIVTTSWENNPNLQEILIAADTTVSFAGQMLNKPIDKEDAQRMLSMMCNRQHEVHTGFVIRDLANGAEYIGVSTAVVTMRNYSQKEISEYIATGDPMDKAGSYAIQNQAFHPVKNLDGCFLNVMGLPLCELIIAMRQFGLNPNFLDTAVIKEHQHFPCPSFPRLEI